MNLLNVFRKKEASEIVTERLDMSREQLKPTYKEFFEGASGKYFIQFINHLVTSNNMKAEDNPDLARDLAQRNKMAREILNHIKGVMTDVK